jgi:hypothetical protein
MSFYSPVCGSITPNIGGSITAVSDTWFGEYEHSPDIGATLCSQHCLLELGVTIFLKRLFKHDSRP